MNFFKKACRLGIASAVALNLLSFNISAADVSPTKFVNSPYDFGLSNFYKPMQGATMDKVYNALRKEYPDEIPVVMPREVKGETKVFVSPDGDDNRGDGSIENPFKTMKTALKAVRKMPFEKKAKGCVVYLRGGVYSLEESLQFSNADFGTKNAPLFISAYNGEEVTVTGATVFDSNDFSHDIESGEKSRLRPEAQDKVLVADLKKKGVEEYGGFNLTTGDYPTQNEASVYSNDSIMTPARYPNNSSISVGTVIDTGPIRTVDGQGDFADFKDDGRGFEFELADGRPFEWKDTGDIYMYGKMFWEWRPGTYKVRSFNKDNYSVRSENYSQYGVREDPLTNYYFFNVFEELDCPGEWFVDKENGLLYIYPFDGEENDLSISFSTSNFDLLALNGAKHIYFDGIKFKYNSKSAVSMKNCEEVVFQNCDISLMGGYGLYMEGCSYSGATTCLLYNCSDSLVRVLPDSNYYYSKKGIPTRNFIQNCFISRQGIEEHSAGIYGGDTGMIISHNLFQKFAAAAITPEGSEVIVEYNEIMNSSYEVEDMGALYAGGLSGNVFTQIRFNYFHDTSAFDRLAETVYLDGFGSLYAVYGNVMKNIPYALKSHTGIKNMWVNNVITENSHSKLSSNIDIAMSYYTQGNPYWPTYVKEMWSGLFSKHWRGAENFLDAFHAKRYPQLYEYLQGVYEYTNRSTKDGYVRDELEDALRTPSGYYFKNNLSYKHEDFVFPDIMYQTMIGRDENYVAKSDPGFADFENGDLSFKEDAEVYKYLPDFEAPPFEKMGLITNGTRWENFGLKKAPELITPRAESDGEEVYSKVSFSWEKTMCAARYRLTVALDPEFENICYDQELDLPNAEVELPQIGADYWWRVEAKTLTKSFENKTLTSKTGHFRVKTYDEMLATERPNTKYLDREIEKIIAFADTLTEGENPGEYAAGTKEALTAEANASKKISESPGIQPETDAALAELKQKTAKIRANINVGFEPLTGFDEDESGDENGGFKATLNTDQKAVSNEGGEIKFDTSAANQQTLTGGQPLKNGIIYTWRAKMDSVEGWMVFGNYEKPESSFGSNNSYCIVISGGSTIELQKYTPSVSYYIIDSVEDGGIIKPGEWQELAFGLIPVEDGIRAVFYVDGELVLDYTDTTDALYYDGGFVVLGNPTNKNIYLAPSQMTYDKIPE